MFIVDKKNTKGINTKEYATVKVKWGRMIIETSDGFKADLGRQATFHDRITPELIDDFISKARESK